MWKHKNFLIDKIKKRKENLMRSFSQEEINNIINDYYNGMCPKDLGINIIEILQVSLIN